MSKNIDNQQKKTKEGEQLPSQEELKKVVKEATEKLKEKISIPRSIRPGRCGGCDVIIRKY